MGGTPSPFLLLARGAAGLLRQVKNAGEKMRGEGLIPLCGRKYSPIKENELKVLIHVVCSWMWWGEREGGESCSSQQKLSPSVGLQEERMRRMDGWMDAWVIFIFFSYGEEGLVLKARGEGRQARLMEITFHSIWRKGEGEKKMSLK